MRLTLKLLVFAHYFTSGYVRYTVGSFIHFGVPTLTLVSQAMRRKSGDPQRVPRLFFPWSHPTLQT